MNLAKQRMERDWNPWRPADVYSKLFFRCSNCQRETELGLHSGGYCNIHLVEFILGVHPDLQWDSKATDFIQYDRFETIPAVYEEIKLCPECTPLVTPDLIRIVSECTQINSWNLTRRPVYHQKDLKKELGHFITLIESGPCLPGRYFNLQVDKNIYRSIVARIPENIRDFHKMVKL